MAILDRCCRCGVQVSCRASEVPMCDECSGRNAARKAEEERWQALSTDEKLNELKTRVDALASRSRWDEVIG